MKSETQNLILTFGSAFFFLSYIFVGITWMLKDLMKINHQDQDDLWIRDLEEISLPKKLLAFDLFLIGYIICVSLFLEKQVFASFFYSFLCLIPIRFIISPLPSIRECAHPRSDLFFVLSLTILAACLRLYRLSDYPPGLIVDEIAIARITDSMIKGHYRPFSMFGFGLPTITFTPQALCYIFLPVARSTMRGYEILGGILCIPAFYTLARVCLPVMVSRIITIFLVFSPYHLLYSRLSFGARILLFEIIILFFAITAINKHSYFRVFFASMGSAILLYDYECARLPAAFLAMAFLIAFAALCLFCFISGLFLLGFGLENERINRINHGINRTPVFVIEEILEKTNANSAETVEMESTDDK